MHVVILAEFAVPSGGAEKVALESAHGLAAAGHEVTYIQAVDGAVDPLLDHPRLRRVCLGLHDAWTRPALAAALSGIWNRTAAERLARALAGLPRAPDCIHLHQWTRSLSPSIFPVLFGTGAPVVLTLHDYFLACPNGVHYRFDRDEPCGHAPLSAGCVAAPCDSRSRAHKLVRVARTAALRWAIGPRRLHVVHICDESRVRMGSMLGGYALEHHRVDNPVRVTREPPASPAAGDALVYVGRMTREKGADLVAEAAHGAGLRALFIGSGPLEAELRGRPGVEVLGWQTPEAARAVLRQRARALAAPSRWFETGPLTVYEALAAGIPAIVSERSGASEKVRHGAGGFVVAPDPDALAAAVAALADETRAAAMGTAAYADFWARPMTMAAHARDLSLLYDSIVPNRSCAAQQSRGPAPVGAVPDTRDLNIA
ncbi:glycosyltransferase [Methylobacterium nigriterrae]|uniref:glycosyltransferase n=1 Tax=Methylobacterium nigriterrae TaxID=3127512 RepID=UPI003013D53A